MYKALLLSVLFSVSSLVSGQTASSSHPLSIAVTKGDKVSIAGVAGDVRLTTKKGARQFTAWIKGPQGEDFPLSLKKENGVIYLKVSGPIEKSAWELAMVDKKWPKYNMNIVVPDVVDSVQLNWWKGKVSVKDLHSSLSVTIQEGKLKVTDSVGDLMAYVQKGTIEVMRQKGAVDAESYSGQVTIKDVEGVVSVNNFTGKSVVEGVEGTLNYNSYSGTTLVKNVKGRFNFKNGRSKLEARGVEGDIRGRSGQGPVKITSNSKMNVNIKSIEGTVSLKIPRSGAHVNVGSEKGGLYVPSFLKMTHFTSLKVKRGKLRGDVKGRVFVRTQSGDIRIQ